MAALAAMGESWRATDETRDGPSRHPASPGTAPRIQKRDGFSAGAIDPSALMDLSAARSLFADVRKSEPAGENQSPGLRALEQLRACPRNIVVGAPGSGKSTFMEWLQLKVASGAEEFVLAGEQAIPLLLRVPQLDMRSLPRGTALIEKATGNG